MLRRQVLGAGAAIAAMPLLMRQAAAQQAAQPVQTAIPEEKQPMLAVGSYSRLTSELALERSRNESVRTFAGLEVAEQLAVAEAFGAAGEPPILTEAQNAALESMRAAGEASFDRVYLEAQIAAHEEGLVVAGRYAADGTDPMAQGAATVAVPAIETHLVMLNGIRASMG